jgi:hypothetical protein
VGPAGSREAPRAAPGAASRRTLGRYAADRACWRPAAWPPGMACLERAGPRTTGIPSWAQRSASQVPREEPGAGDDAIIPRRGPGPEPRVWTGVHLLVSQQLTGLVQATDGQRPGVPVDPTSRVMRLGGDGPEVSSVA